MSIAAQTYAFTLGDGTALTLAGATVLDLVPLEVDDALTTLEQLVLVSLLTDRRAGADDALPAEGGDPPYRGGWVGDTYAGDALSGVAGDKFGSRLWLLYRSKATAETIERAKKYAEEGLQWLVDDGIAQSVVVTAERVERARGGPLVGLSVTVVQGTATRQIELWTAALS